MTATDTTEIRERIDRLEVRLNQEVLERTVEISCLINAVLSRQHLCILGSWGTAKTYLARTFVDLTDLSDEDYFEVSLGRFDDPAKVIGPHSMVGLQADEFYRITRRRLPRARVATVDELGRGSESLFDYFLPILNERKFYEGEPDRGVTVPLSTFIGLSNTSPENSETLKAFWDRLTFHLVSQRLMDPANVTAMLRSGVERRQATGATAHALVEPVIAWDDIMTAQAEVAKVEIGDDVLEGLTSLRQALAAQEVYPSDRRLVDSLSVIQAAAWRAGRSVAEPRDMRLLAHVMWELQRDREEVQRRVYDIASPLDSRALRIADQLRHIGDAVSAMRAMTSRDQIEAEGTRLHEQLEALADKVEKLSQKAARQGEAVELIEPLTLQIIDLSQIVYGMLDNAANRG